MVQATQLLARDLATKNYKTRHSLKMMSPTEYRKFRKAEPLTGVAFAHIHGNLPSQGAGLGSRGIQ